jgi:hypothetical protein
VGDGDETARAGATLMDWLSFELVNTVIAAFGLGLGLTPFLKRRDDYTKRPLVRIAIQVSKNIEFSQKTRSAFRFNSIGEQR